jgi:hypothetical protein
MRISGSEVGWSELNRGELSQKNVIKQPPKGGAKRVLE